jgi:hypothetical protein
MNRIINSLSNRQDSHVSACACSVSCVCQFICFVQWLVPSCSVVWCRADSVWVLLAFAT